MIREFIKYQNNVRGLSPRTLEEYEKNLKQFVTWAQPRGLRWSTICKQDIDSWTMEMTSSGIKAATVKQRISTLRTMFAWMEHEGMRADNPARYCQTPKIAEKLPSAADMDAIDAYLGTPSVTKEERDVKMLTAIICETGCRLSEALKMRKSDFQQCGIRIKGKGGLERIVFYGHRTRNAIRAAAPTGDELFEGWSDVSIRYAMYRTLGTVIPSVHPHMLRHTFAMQALNNGIAINEVSQLLGHKHITTTQIYARAAVTTLQQHYQQTMQ